MEDNVAVMDVTVIVGFASAAQAQDSVINNRLLMPERQALVINFMNCDTSAGFFNTTRYYRWGCYLRLLA